MARTPSKPPANVTNPSNSKSQTTPFSNTITNSLSIQTSSTNIEITKKILPASSVENAIDLCESPYNNKKDTETTEMIKSFKFLCLNDCPFDTTYSKKWNTFNNETLLGLKRCSKEDVSFMEKVLNQPIKVELSPMIDHLLTNDCLLTLFKKNKWVNDCIMNSFMHMIRYKCSC